MKAKKSYKALEMRRNMKMNWLFQQHKKSLLWWLIYHQFINNLTLWYLICYFIFTIVWIRTRRQASGWWRNKKFYSDSIQFHFYLKPTTIKFKLCFAENIQQEKRNILHHSILLSFFYIFNCNCLKIFTAMVCWW